MQAKKQTASPKQDAKYSLSEQPMETNKERLASAGKIIWQKDQRSTCDKLAYSVKEAAEALGVSVWYIRDEMAQGQLGFSCPRGRQLIPRWELVRYLESNMSPSMRSGQEAEAEAAFAEALRLSARRKQVMA